MAGFVDSGTEADVDRKALASATFIHPANGRNVAVVTAIGNADVTKLDGLAESGIETDPAVARQKYFGPSVRSLAADDFLLFVACFRAARDDIAGDVARGEAAHAHNAEQKMSEILADAGA